MNNMKKSIWNQRLPRFSVLIILALALTTIFWLSRNLVLFGTKAAAGSTPKNVEISNIADTSFSLSYLTDDNVLGSISYTNVASSGGVVLDDRDKQAGVASPHRAHYITIGGLEPGQKYSFSIISGDEQFQNQGVPYEVTTAPASTQTPTNEYRLVGKTTLDDGNIPLEGIVYISSDTSQLLSILLNVDGSFLLPLNTIRTKGLTAFDALSPTTVLKMKVASPTQSSNVSLFANQTNPVPPIILSKDYDFTISNASASPTLTASQSGVPTIPLTGLPVVEDSTIASSPSILVPSDDFKFKDRQPTFKGKALPNATVEVTVQSDPITASVQADAKGNWEFRPAAPLDTGEHTITIKSADTQGATQIIARAFTVLADGSQFLEPSVSPIQLTPTPGPTLVPTITPIPTITPTPTIDPRTLITPTISATKTPIKAPGSVSVTTGIFLSMLSLAIGGILFFLTRGTTTHL